MSKAAARHIRTGKVKERRVNPVRVARNERNEERCIANLKRPRFTNPWDIAKAKRLERRTELGLTGMRNAQKRTSTGMIIKHGPNGTYLIADSERGMREYREKYRDEMRERAEVQQSEDFAKQQAAKKKAARKPAPKPGEVSVRKVAHKVTEKPKKAPARKRTPKPRKDIVA